MCFQDWRADLEAPIPVRLLRSHPGEETRSELPSPVLEPQVACLCWVALQAHCQGLSLTKGDFPDGWQTL